MQALNSNQSLSVILTGAVTTAELPWIASYFDLSGPTIQNPEDDINTVTGTTNGGTGVTMVTSPTVGNRRQIKFVSLHNQDTVTHNPTVRVIDSGTVRRQVRVELAVNDTLFYVDSVGWYVLTATGSIKMVDSVEAAQQHVSRNILSGSTNGRPIAVAATATPGTLIHTAVSGAVAFDEVWAWITNRTGTAATLTIEFGGVSNSDHLTEAMSIPANSGPIAIVTGQVLNGGLVFRAFSGTANALNMSGYINRFQ